MRSPADYASARVRRVQDSVRRTRAAVTQPKPPVEINTGATVPCWLLRVITVGLGALAIMLLDPGIVGMVIMVGSVLVLAIRPGAATGAVFCLLLGLGWMVTPSPPFSADQFALLALGPAAWTLAGVITDLPLRARIEWRVLLRPAVRLVIIDLVAQLLLIGAQVLQTRGPALAPSLAGLIAFGCAIVVAVAGWLLLPRLSAAPDPD